MITEEEINYDGTMHAFSKEDCRKANRSLRPIIDMKKCKKCMICIALCPKGCITDKEGLVIDYNVCDGCLICLRECSYGAITEEKEV